jgi:uncharacterized protein YkwD/uncharacterized membrane protein required for colicin V production
MNYADLLLILIVLLSILRGSQRGFLLGMLGLLRWIASLWLALRFYQPVAGWLGARATWAAVWNRPVAFALIAIGTSLLIGSLELIWLRRLPKEAHTRRDNRLLGVVPGAINGLIAAAIVADLLLSLPAPEGLQAAARDSALANRLAGYAERFEAAIAPAFQDAIAQTLNLLTIRPESHERVDLPYTVADAPARPDLEAQMLALVNQERANAGLAALALDPALTQEARRHSADMLARGYFAHTSPEGFDLAGRLAAAEISYHIAGENLALAPTLQLAHTGLMNSPEHRENILRPAFGRVGIGIVDGGVHGLMITQVFRD